MKFVPRSETTRKFIVETTASIFNTKGYAGTSMSDLTEATQLTKGSIYGNFENKEEVAFAAFEYNATQRQDAIDRWMRQADTYRGKLLALVTLHTAAERHVMPKGGCPLLNAGTEADDTHEPLRKRVAEEILHWRKDLILTVRKGIEAGEFKPGTDANKTAVAIMSLIEGGIFITRTTRNPAHLDTALETVRDIIETITLPTS